MANQKQVATVKSIIVTRAEAGQKIQDFLSKKFSISKREAKALLDGHRVWVNRRSIWMAHHLVHQGDAVEIQTAGVRIKSKEGTLTKPEAPKRIPILSECDDYLVANKPSQMLSVGRNSMEELLRVQTGNPDLCAVHRLDRDTTGCLLFAKSEEAFDAAVQMFKTHQVIKMYQAVVLGYYERNASTIQQELDGERAVSRIWRLLATKDASFLKIRIETGRTHQIRRHLSMLHYPVLGDKEYGRSRVMDPRIRFLPRQMLHACSLELPNPMRPHETIKAHSPLPADFRRCLQLFGMGK